MAEERFASRTPLEGEGDIVDRKYFRGKCTVCHTEYETSSARDDLSGVKFRCKKDSCNGEVVLEDFTYQKWREQRYEGKFC